MDRRRFLASTVAVGAITLAGCTGGSGGGSDSGGGSGDGGSGGSDGGTDGSGGTPIEDHAATSNLESQPVLGDAADTLVVAFEDPSCTLCRRFETNTYPEIESELVDTGKASFAYRGLPIIYPWGEPAAHVLEATFAANAEAFWALKDHYYATQSEFDDENVYDRSRSFLASETAVDADAVVTAAKNGEADAAVQTDLAAGEELGIGQTPEFYLFRDGEFRTVVRGAQGYSVFENALGF